MAGDSYWYYKVLGLHCNGTNGSTTFADVGPSPKTVTANGNAQISTAQYPSLTGKTSSGYFDGSGDYLSIPDSTAWDMGTGDFTIRFLCRPTSNGSDREIIAQRKSGENSFWFIRHTTAGKVRVFASVAGTVVTDVTSTADLTNNAWQLVEVVRTSGSVKISIDGTFGTSITTDNTGSWPSASTSPLYICVGDDTFGAGNFFTGYVSEIEIYKGAALHTTTFTPPTAPFADEYVYISGTTKDSTNTFSSRLVRVYRRDTGVLVGSVISNGTTGTYKVTAANSGTTTPLKHFVLCFDATADPPGSPTENALVFDDITPA